MEEDYLAGSETEQLRRASIDLLDCVDTEYLHSLLADHSMVDQVPVMYEVDDLAVKSVGEMLGWMDGVYHQIGCKCTEECWTTAYSGLLLK